MLADSGIVHCLSFCIKQLSRDDEIDAVQQLEKLSVIAAIMHTVPGISLCRL